MKKELIRKLLMKTIREHLSTNDRFNGRKPSVTELEELLDKEIKTSGTLTDAILAVFKLSLK